MKRVLCISPHFPPINAPDMQRLRQSLGFFSENGWQPTVVCVAAEHVEQSDDLLLMEAIPDSLEVVRCGAVPITVSRKLGIGNVGIRSLPHLYLAISKCLKEKDYDLLFFSTTMFVTLILGPVFKKKYGIPFIVDMQDPWRNDYYLGLPRGSKSWKFWVNYRIQSFLEARTMPHCDGILSVSQTYIDVLKDRYKSLKLVPELTLPFSALQSDVETAAKIEKVFFGDDVTNIVYVGRGGADLKRSIDFLFEAFQLLIEENPDIADRVRFHFIGTSYASKGQGQPTILPVAEKFNLERRVTESTDRVPYFEGLQMMKQAHAILIPGSDDLAYNASKIYSCLMAERPIIAIAARQSPMLKILEELGIGGSICFDAEDKEMELSHLKSTISDLCQGVPVDQAIDSIAFRKYTAPEVTRRLCAFFDIVVQGVRGA